jgi:hypothetical protein
MKNLLLGIIAINLTIISINMTLKSIESAHAEFIYNGNDYNECIDLANSLPILTSRVKARKYCDSQAKPKVISLDFINGNEFVLAVKSIIETCRVKNSSGITTIIPDTNIGVGGSSRGKIICD